MSIRMKTMSDSITGLNLKPTNSTIIIIINNNNNK